MNWEFLLGLLLPAYGAGYIWLIKTAREDPPLYRVIESQLKGICLAVAALLAVLAFAIPHVVEGPRPFMNGLGAFMLILIGMNMLLLQSLSLFRRISEMPPRTAQSHQEPAPHTGEPTQPGV
ncbi:hypothetical protein N5K27_22560 [Pigmentiphaga sp. GD03639]|uniref:hypothetical protein n=1 Tax=Pigmentiphaga sp. GD03639 TaxID=2975354 RepID=UPI0024479A33|nr:hypothetical protein [Pigmentiphaga sp. GD03639]MDH2239095.1 hypothetical protein [Pigmentiphaga sp. GD03639]